MKHLFFILFILLPFLPRGQSGQGVGAGDNPVVMECSDTLAGDFNGDGKKEYLYVHQSSRADSSTVTCSNKKIPPFSYKAMGSCLSNEGDLDDNKTDEVTVNAWAEGAWGWMMVYTFRKGHWIKTIENFTVFGPDGHTDYVKKGPGKGEATIQVDDFGYDGQDKSGPRVVKLK